MIVGIMQPYFLPYIGYFQLMNLCDTFVIYDNIQFTKKGWIRRNKYLSNGKERMFSLNLKKDSSRLDIVDRFMSESYYTENEKTLRSIKASYSKAPFFKETFEMLEECFLCKDTNLFNFIWNSINIVSNHLEINTNLIKSSNINANHNLKKEERVIDICSSLGAKTYINLSGGISLYSKDNFLDKNIELLFMECLNSKYTQKSKSFVPRLSIIDILMFISVEDIKEKFLKDFKIIK